MNHGKTKFDKDYYKRFFSNYSKDEFDIYCNWAEGWVNFLTKYVPSLKNGNGKNLLEIGSSMGYFSFVFKKRGFDILCSDISSYILKKAKTKQKNVDFKVVDIEKGLKSKQKFDYIVGFEVLEHLKNPEKAIKNIYKSLKHGGVLIFSTPFPTKISLSDPTHINVHKESWWLNKGKLAGFRSRKLIPASFIPFLYRLDSRFSVGFPIKTNLPLVNCTAFYIFKK